ncbi:MAG: hypothetical protein ACTS5A_01365 [Candidatus Hodgkinia cicadicola]
MRATNDNQSVTIKRNISESWNPELKWGTKRKIKTINRLKDFRVKLTGGKTWEMIKPKGGKPSVGGLNIDEEMFNIESEELMK